ncbi:DUF6504 family protein [Paenarthrobacter sp. NPDC089675]|uniref:DUF6504 family protein n=1 Tax=Paenarthrobacter sp. NPDC089675 TaxID=3364376 RepID=UPI0038201F47
MGLFSESIDVICTEEGSPQRVNWRGNDYQVCADPVRWYERRQWWSEETRAPLGTGAGLVDHEIWRVQLKEMSGPDTGKLITLDVVRHIGSGRWRLVRIHDAAPSRAVEPEEAA